MGSTLVRLTRLVAYLPVTLLVTGCVSPTVAPTESQPDRLKRFYPDLSAGRFLILADFEDPAHARLFELVNASGQARVSRQSTGGRPETGQAALTFTAGSPQDNLVAGSGNAEREYLKRDWRAFDLLIASIHSPSPNLSTVVTAASGVGANRRVTETAVPLQQGWNTIRLDLAELAENINIDDVQELRLAIAGQRRPTEIIIDDLLLTGSCEDLFGDSANTTGALYVQRVGKRWNVGAGGAFELTVMNGQIRRLHNLGTDPHRVHNLVEGVSLGPMPVAVDPTGRQNSLCPPGARIAVQQRLIEMNSVRTILEITWRVESGIAADPGAGGADLYRWQYAIYSSGQIYCRADVARTDGQDWSVPIAAAVAFSSAGIELSAGSLAESTGNPGAPYGWALHGPSGTLVTVIPSADQSAAGQIQTVRDDAQRQSAMLIPSSQVASPMRSWIVQFAVSSIASADTHSFSDEVVARANAYTRPVHADATIGSIHAAESRPDGFNQGLGHFAIIPDSDRVRITLSGNPHPVYSPAFTVHQSVGRDVWVYVDHLVHKQTARDSEGNLLFQIPGRISKPVLVEIILRGSPTSSTP